VPRRDGVPRVVHPRPVSVPPARSSARSKLVSRLVFGLIAVFFAVAALELGRRLRETPIDVRPAWLLASVLVFGLGNTGLALAFRRVLRQGSGVAQPVIAVLELFYRGTLARYLPGKVGIPAVRMAAAPEFQVSVGFMAGTVVLETLASLATCGAVAALISSGPWASPTLREITHRPAALALIAGVFLGVLGLAVIDLRHYPRFLRRLLRSEDREGPLLPGVWLLGCSFAWLCVGISNGLCAHALSENLDTALLAAAAGVLAPIVGFLAMVAPGGLGVREAFLVAVLTPQIGGTRALAFSLLSRAVALGAELGLWLVARAALALRAKPSVPG
jgi:hypothetical protein